MGETLPSDSDLAKRALGGDAEALAVLLERYRPSLYAAAIGLLRDRDEAQDAVQEACVVALVRIGSLRDPAAVGGWLHRVLRNICLMRLRSQARTRPHPQFDVSADVRSLDEVLDRLVLRDWLWTAIDELAPEDRLTVLLRHFTRSSSYDAVAAVTGVPIGTVRSRLSRARRLLATALQSETADPHGSRSEVERNRRAEWEGFYAELHEKPTPRTYLATYSTEVEVSDRNGRWQGVRAWSDHERQAIELGVRAHIVGLVASRDITVIEIDFTNPGWASDHCPPRSTFVHRLAGGRSRRLDIHYV